MTTPQLTIARSYGIYSLSSFAITGFLLTHGKTPVGVLSNHLGTTAANVTGIIGALKATGIVARTHSRTDRRVVYITLTKLGEEVAAQLHNLPAAV